MSPNRIVKKQDHLAVAMKVGFVEVRRVKKNTYKLIFRLEQGMELPEVPKSKNISLVPIRVDKVPFGIDSDGYVVKLPLFTNSGGTNTLIGGNPGQGKTSALKIILFGLIETNTCIIWFDPKAGSDAIPYRERVNVISNPLEPIEYLKALRNISSIIYSRNKLVSLGYDISIFPRIVLFVDEWGTLGNMGSKQDQTEIQSELRKIVSIGRSSNVSVVLATQRPTSANVDVATRELCNNRVAFQVGDDHGSEAILGQKGAENKENPLNPGQALVWLDGRLVRTNLFSVPQNLTDITSQNIGLKATLEDLMESDRIFRREHQIED